MSLPGIVSSMIPPSTLEQLQRFAAVGAQIVNPSLLNPCTWVDRGADVANRAADGCHGTTDGTAALAAREVFNKTQIFLLVSSVGRLIGTSQESFPLPLGELLQRAYGLGSFRALWAVEGLGHDYAASFFHADLEPRKILAPPVASRLPSSSLLMLNAGIGLAFAEDEIQSLPYRPEFPAIDKAVRETIALTEGNATPGLEGPSFESLGLETRLFYPHLTGRVVSALEAHRPDLLGYFWHGAGRALYFSPINFLPFSIWQTYEMALEEAPDERALLNLDAGITWAFLLVNQRQPAIMAELLIGPYGERLLRRPGFRNGIASATVMRTDTTPDAPFLRPFAQFQPFPGQPRKTALWNELVRHPYVGALDFLYPTLKATGRLGSVFQYQDLDALTTGLS